MPSMAQLVHRFHRWYREAEAAGTPQPDAMALATVDKAGAPSLRWVLLKSASEAGFVFFTDKRSRKGKALRDNPRAAATFFWGLTGKSVRIEGRVEHLSKLQADAYWHSRPRGSQLSAAASRQSAPIDSRRTLVARRARLAKALGTGQVPRPEAWGGFLIVPERIEFWEHRGDRLHHREQFTRTRTGWKKSLLQP
jgi:pyridoxamine 5'-phosphate oxidase